jgi:hypothetical protein
MKGNRSIKQYDKRNIHMYNYPNMIYMNIHTRNYSTQYTLFAKTFTPLQYT